MTVPCTVPLRAPAASELTEPTVTPGADASAGLAPSALITSARPAARTIFFDIDPPLDPEKHLNPDKFCCQEEGGGCGDSSSPRRRSVSQPRAQRFAVPRVVAAAEPFGALGVAGADRVGEVGVEGRDVLDLVVMGRGQVEVEPCLSVEELEVLAQ